MYYMVTKKGIKKEISFKDLDCIAFERTENAKICDCEAARKVGTKIAERALAKNITEVVFDRGGYLYHGRVKELAEGAREGGLKF